MGLEKGNIEITVWLRWNCCNWMQQGRKPLAQK